MMRLKQVGTKFVATAVAAGTLAVGTTGVAFAVEGGDPAAGSGTASEQRVRRGPRLEVVRTAFTAAAEVLGLSVEDLRSQVKDGPQSIATIAGDQTADVVAAVLAAVTARIDEAVANGTIPADRAEQAKARLPEFADRFVNRVPGQHPQQ